MDALVEGRYFHIRSFNPWADVRDGQVLLESPKPVLRPAMTTGDS